MARGKAHLKLPDGSVMYARTDLHGYGIIHEGEEFVAREMWANGNGLLRGGRKLRVRVVKTQRVTRRHHVLTVEVVEDLTPEDGEQGELFQ